MKWRLKKLYVIILLPVFIVACHTSEKKTPERYGIKGDGISLRDGAGDNYDKIINKTASERLNEIHYMSINQSVKIVVIEEEGEWAHVRVIDPSHLARTHVGWIPSKFIDRGENSVSSDDTEELDKSSYDIIKTNHYPAVANFHVLIKFSNFNEEDIMGFIKKFRNEYCRRSCNVYVYDSDRVLPHIDQFDLGRNEYLLFADHFVAWSTDSSPNTLMWYPFQDIQYKEYGGENWKKEP